MDSVPQSPRIRQLKSPTIRRAKHGKDNPYFLMLRETAQDRNLSYEARGMLAYILSRPDDWHVQVDDLIMKSTDGKVTKAGKSKVYGILDELADARYIVKPKRFQDDKGKYIWTPYEVYERPYPDLPYMDSPYTDKPDILHSTDEQSRERESSSAPAPEVPEAPKPTPAEADAAIYGASKPLDAATADADEARRILELPPHLKNATLDNMLSHPLIDAYSEVIGAPYIATRHDKINALRAVMAGYTPDDMRATVKARRKPGALYALSWAFADMATVKASTPKPRMSGHMLDDLDPNAPDYWDKVAERLRGPKQVIA